MSDTQKLIEEYIANGGKVTKLETGAKGLKPSTPNPKKNRQKKKKKEKILYGSIYAPRTHLYKGVAVRSSGKPGHGRRS